MRNWVLTTLTTALSSFALLVTLNPQQAAADQCSNGTIQGAYSFEVSGWIGTGVKTNPFLPAIVSRLVDFDGNGNWEGGGVTVVAGVAGRTSLSGTYDVKPDCTVNFEYSVFNEDQSLNSVTTLFGVIVDRGKKVHGLVTRDANNSIAPPNNVTLSVSFQQVK